MAIAPGHPPATAADQRRGGPTSSSSPWVTAATGWPSSNRRGRPTLPPELLDGPPGPPARRPFENGEIQVWYQPMVDMASGRLLGAEALVRWAHPGYGVLGPGLFLPIAVGPRADR